MAFTERMSTFLRPFDASEHSQTSVRAKVDRVGCLDSRVYTIKSEDTEKIKRGSVWQAALVTSLSPQKIRIGLCVEGTS